MGKIKFALFLILIFFFLGSKILFAQEVSVTPLVITSPTVSEKQSVNYTLPYPGLLPDNPLYFLRVIRDKIVGFLISDSLKKAEFNLLQADKRLNAGIYLFNKNKISKALSTISKAENYFGESLHKIQKAREEGINIQEITRKLLDSSKKHQQVLKSLEEKSPQNFKSSFNLQLKRVNGFAEEATALTLK